MTDVRDRCTAGLVALAALCGVVAVVLPWRSRGIASAIAPYELARAVLAGGLGDGLPRAAGLVVLAPVLAAAVLVVLAPYRRARRLSGGVAALLCAVPLAVLTVLPGPPGLAPGGVLLVVAATSALALALVTPRAS